MTVSDGAGGLDVATVDITVGGSNDAPVASDDLLGVTEDTAGEVDVTANDSDGDGDALTVTLVDGPANGTATVDGAAIDYIPSANFAGTDTILYQVSDGNGGTATATVTIGVAAVNDAPTAADSHHSTAFGTALTADLNVIDVDDGDDVDVATVTGPANGTVTFGSPRFTYTPAPGFPGTDQFTYLVTDPAGATATATAIIDVGGAPPTTTAAPTTTAPSAGELPETGAASATVMWLAAAAIGLGVLALVSQLPKRRQGQES